MKKRLVSMILSAVLFATSVPVAAFAEDANTQNPVMHSEECTGVLYSLCDSQTLWDRCIRIQSGAYCTDAGIWKERSAGTSKLLK